MEENFGISEDQILKLKRLAERKLQEATHYFRRERMEDFSRNLLFSQSVYLFLEDVKGLNKCSKAIDGLLEYYKKDYDFLDVNDVDEYYKSWRDRLEDQCERTRIFIRDITNRRIRIGRKNEQQYK